MRREPNLERTEPMSNKTHVIEIDGDHHEAAEFVAWLNKEGHDATIGHRGSDYVDGDGTYYDEDAQSISNTLWENYCNS